MPEYPDDMTSSKKTKSALERRYRKRRSRGKMLSPVRLAPTAEHPLGLPVRVTTRYRKTGDLWALGYHTGADFACPVGSWAVATSYGTVVWAGEFGGWSAPPKPGKPWAYGVHVVIRTGSRKYDYAYCHLSQALVKEGQRVTPGQVIGVTGNTGNTTGAHVHFEARPAGGRYGSDVSPSLVRRRRKKN